MEDYANCEFIILTEDRQLIQTKLNQWRHGYRLKIISMCASSDIQFNQIITLLLIREKK